MFLSFFSPKRSYLTSRGFPVGKKFLTPSPEDIVFKALCVNLKQRRWKFLEKISASLMSSLLSRVFFEFRTSPLLALEFYNWVGKTRNFPHSLGSSCTLIHVLVNSRKFDDALLIMENLLSINGASALEVLKGLIDSYESWVSSPAVFDALVRACTRLGTAEGAYEVIKKLKMEGCWVSIHAWNNFLNFLLKLDEIDRFWAMYKEMISYGYKENVNTYNLLIYAFCKECQLMEAISVFYLMLKSEIWPNIVTFNMIIDKASKMSELELALKLVRNIGVMSGDSVFPNVVTYNCIMNGFSKLGRVEVAVDVCTEMKALGITPNLQTYGTLIDGYARGGKLEEALELCGEMVEKGLIPDTVVYNSLIHWLYMDGDVKEASFLLSDMNDKSIHPDRFTYSIVTKGLCRNRCLSEALRFHNEIMGKNLIEDAFPHNILIKYLLKRNKWEEAKQLLCSMFVIGLSPDTVTYGTLIDGYCKRGDIEIAVEVYDELIKVERKPNLVVYNSIVHGLCKQTLVNGAEVLTHKLKQTGLNDVITYNTMLNGYCISGMIQKAFRLFLGMNEAEEAEGGILVNTVSYNIMINILCKFGDFHKAKELMKLMILQGMTPDIVTYTTLISNFSKRCRSEEVIELHDYMVLKGVIPDRPTYGALVAPLLKEEKFME